MVPYWKHVGLWLLLFSGVCGVGSNIAALFGYSGAYTLELVIGCIAMSLVVGALSYRLASKGSAAAPRQPFEERRKALPYQNWTKAQKLRWFFAWTGSGIVFLILDFIVDQMTQHLFPDLIPQMVIAITLAISGPLAALFGVTFYQRVLTDVFPD